MGRPQVMKDEVVVLIINWMSSFLCSMISLSKWILSLWIPLFSYVLSYGFKMTNALLCWDPRPLLTSVQWFEKQHMATDRTWHPHGPCRTGLQSPLRVLLVAVGGNGIRDWYLMDAGLSNSIRLFIYLPSRLQLWEATSCLHVVLAKHAVKFRSDLI